MNKKNTILFRLLFWGRRRGYKYRVMRKLYFTVTLFILVSVHFLSCGKDSSADKILQLYSKSESYVPLTIHSPLDGTCFPLDIAPPILTWYDNNEKASIWYIVFVFSTNNNRLCYKSDTTCWKPLPEQWEEIKSGLVTHLGVI